MAETSSPAAETRPAGDLPPWRVADLPEPLPFSIRNLFKTIGPGAILLCTAIGGGEWLVGPAAGVKHGMSVFWIATVGIFLQTLFNLEGIRYTLYTGEPIVTGIMRLQPGSKFWGTVYSLMTVIQLGVPALAAECGHVMFALVFGRVAGNNDAGTAMYFVYLSMGMAVALLCFGGTIELMLERLSWGMIAYIFTFLTVANLMFVPWEKGIALLQGFLPIHNVAALFSGSISPTDWLKGTDLLLLGTLAATAGAGGVGNLTISNWVRDKGMGMGSLVGAIGTVTTSEQHTLASTGTVFPITPENMRRWKIWWAYVKVDQIWLWGLGCFIGMYLNVNLAIALIDPGADMEGTKTGTQLATAMSGLWSGFWYLALLNGFWILFSTHLGNTDVMARLVTDIWWVASPEVRAKAKGQISRVYYFVLAIVTVWGCFAVRWGQAMALFKFLGFMANLILAVSAIQILIVNRTLLPKELRPSWIRQGALIGCAIFFGFFFILMGGNEISKILQPKPSQKASSAVDLQQKTVELKNEPEARQVASQPRDLNPVQQLVVAAFELDVPAVRRLMDAGADVNAIIGEYDRELFNDKWTGSFSHMGSARWTPLMAVANSHREPQPTGEVAAGSDEAFKHLAAIPRKSIDERDRRRMQIAQLLVKAGAKLDFDDGYGATALYSAIYSDYEELALFLIDQGANVNTKTDVYIDGAGDESPLHRATGNPKLVAALLKKGAVVNAKNTNGDTPLHWASLSRDVESVRLLISAGANVNAKTDKGQNALVWTDESSEEDLAAQDRLDQQRSEGNKLRLREQNQIRKLLVDAGAKP